MKIKKMLAAVMAATMLITATACDKGDSTSPQSGNIPTSNTQTGEGMVYEFKDFLDYTFNGSYIIGEPKEAIRNAETEYAQTITSWEITYTAKNGEEKNTKYRSSNYIDIDAQHYKSKENHDLAELDSFVTSTIGENAKNEFVEKIASKYLELQYDEIRGVYICPDIGDLSIYAYTPVFIGALEGENFDKTCEIAKERMTVGSGYSIAEYDLKNVCTNSDFIFTCQFVINKDLDKAKYSEIMENMMKDLKEYTGTPQNFNFFLAESENPEWIIRTMHFKGEEIPSDKIDSGEIVYADEVMNAILANH